MYLIQCGVIDIFAIYEMPVTFILDLLGGESWDTHEGSLVVRASCKNFVMIG